MNQIVCRARHSNLARAYIHLIRCFGFQAAEEPFEPNQCDDGDPRYPSHNSLVPWRLLG